MQIRELITDILGLMTASCSEKDALRLLQGMLNRLEESVRVLGADPDETDYPEPPASDFEKIKNRVRHRFPSLHEYMITEDIGDEVMTRSADAVTDLAELVDELTDVLWYFEKTSPAYALYQLRTGFEMHWGRTLSDLNTFLFS